MSNREIRKTPIKPKGALAECFDWLDSVVISVFCIVLIFTFAFRLVGVEGSSMVDTLHDGDRVIIENINYTPSRGDIVVISRADKLDMYGNPEEPIIKRVIGLEGDVIRFDFENGDVYVNDKKLVEDYISEKTYNAGNIPCPNPTTVQKGKIFVMGDNRPYSKDSRTEEIGQVDTRYVLGRAVVRVFPFNDFKTLFDS